MMKKYEEYKESGNDILGDIPKHWKWLRGKFCIEIQNGFPFKSELFSNEHGFPLLRIRDITSGELSTFYQGEFSNDYVISKSDVLIGMDGDFNLRWWEGNEALLNQRCCRIFSLETLNQRFLYYVLPFILKKINDLAYFTTVKHLSNTDLNESVFPIPSLPEQTQIASYLDHQTALIDTLIAKKEALIEKLKLQRQAVINEAVTRGLDKNVKLVDSGVEWLGMIPEGWEVVKLRYLSTKIGSGVTPRGGAEVYSDEGIIFVRSQNVHFDGLKLNDVSFISEEIHDSMSNSKVQKNDILLNITGASIGRCCVVEIEDEMNVNQHVCIIRPTSDVLSRFLNFVLQSNVGQNQVKLGTTGGNREGLNFEAIKEFNIPLPNLEYQQEIIVHVESITQKIGSTIATIETQITKLKLYRQSLISEAVTGKVDLREWG